MVNLFRRTIFSFFITLRSLLSPVAFGALGLVERDGKLVLVRHSYTTGWHLPGGGAKRGEPPAEALLRELREEIGLTRSRPPELFGLYTRKVWPVTNVNAVYRVRDAVFEFKPNWEVREILLVDPADPPPGLAPGARRRMAELTGQSPQSPYW